MHSTAILVPVYNEQEALEEILSQIKEEINEIGLSMDIFVVDDGSSDRSAHIARNFTPNVLSLRKNRGVGAATRIGFNYILSQTKHYDFILKIDGDGQHDSRYIPQILEYLEEGYDIVTCSRFHPESDQHYTPYDRIFLNGSFAHLVQMVTDWSITDARTGYMGFKRELIQEILPHMEIDRYGVPIEILLLIHHVKPDARIIELAHPAVYGGDISLKLKQKYSQEEIHEKAVRISDGYEAFLLTTQKLDIPRERLMRVNGFKHF